MNALMNIKKSILVLFVFSFGMALNAQESVIQQTELPKTAQTFLSKNFAGQKAVQSIKDKGVLNTEYEVLLDNGTKVEFDSDGNWKDVNSKNGKALPT